MFDEKLWKMVADHPEKDGRDDEDEDSSDSSLDYAYASDYETTEAVLEKQRIKVGDYDLEDERLGSRAGFSLLERGTCGRDGRKEQPKFTGDYMRPPLDWNWETHESHKRNCHEKDRDGDRCDKLNHESCFGNHMIELYSVTLIANSTDDNLNLSGKLHGIIETEYHGWPKHKPPSAIATYYEVKKEDAVTIDLSNGNTYTLPLSGPQLIAPVFETGLSFIIALKFNDEDLIQGPHVPFGVQYHQEYQNSQVFGSDEVVKAASIYNFSVQEDPFFDKILRQEILCGPLPFAPSPIKVVIDYARFGSACSTTVSLRIGRQAGVNRFYGSVSARACVFYTSIPLLQTDESQARDVHLDEPIPLSRSVVAIPSYSTLVVESKLYDQNKRPFFNRKTCFPSFSEGDLSKCYDDDGVTVTVTWNTRR